MEVKQPSTEVAQLLADFQHRGGVIDYVIMQADDEPVSAYDLHKEAAMLTLENATATFDSNAVLTLKAVALNDLEAWRSLLAIQPDMAQGKPISYTEFLGPYFDQQRQSLIMPDGTGGPDFMCHAYADAFTEPPQPMRGTLDELNALFHALNERLFGRLDADTEIYQWSTDWSNYFDFGKEWWGAFLWTVRNNEQDTYVGVAASTSD